MKSSYLLISRIVGIYLSFSILCILYYCYVLGVVGLLSYLIPSVISVTVFLLFDRAWKKQQKNELDVFGGGT